MHNINYDDLFFHTKVYHGSQGGDQEYCGTSLASHSVTRADTLARIQQGMLERAKNKYYRGTNQNKQYHAAKGENKATLPQQSLWRDRQLRDYRKANGLCFSYGENFVPGHLEVCTKETNLRLML